MSRKSKDDNHQYAAHVGQTDPFPVEAVGERECHTRHLKRHKGLNNVFKGTVA